MQPSPELFMTALSMSIQKRRQELNLSQEEISKRSGLHRTYISELERHSRNFSVKSYLKLVEALEMKPSELMRLAEIIANGDGNGGASPEERKEATT
jgi:transcriptional regulator with XRE-family HTH domain